MYICITVVDYYIVIIIQYTKSFICAINKLCMSIPDFLRWRCQVSKKAYTDLIDCGYSDSAARILVYYYIFLNELINPKATAKLESTSYYGKYRSVSQRMSMHVQKYRSIHKSWGDTTIPGQWTERYRSTGRWYE